MTADVLKDGHEPRTTVRARAETMKGLPHLDHRLLDEILGFLTIALEPQGEFERLPAHSGAGRCTRLLHVLRDMTRASRFIPALGMEYCVGLGP